MSGNSFLSDKNYIVLIVVFFVTQTAYLISEYILTNGQFGVPLDDVWIHFRFAETFSQGHFFEYNIGVPTPGTTSPLWVAILSIPFLISSKLILPFALFISSVCFLTTVILVYGFCIRLEFKDKNALFTALITLLCGRLLWSSLSGMEITLFCLLSLWIFHRQFSEYQSQKVFASTGLLLGLAVNTRPEAYLLVAIYFLVTFILLRKVLKENIGKICLSIICFLILALPYPIFCYTLTGKFLPNTFEGQGGGFNYLPNTQFLVETCKLFFKENLVVLSLWIISIGYFLKQLAAKSLDRKYLFLYLWIFLLPLASSFIAPNWRHHGRYLIPLVPIINIAAVILLQELIDKIKNRQQIIRKVFLAVILIASVNSAVIFSQALGWNVQNINDQQVKIAKWLNENLSNEKSFAVNDIGAITFFTKKNIVDMEGLVTPEIFKFQKMGDEENSKNLFALLKKNDVNYIVIYPHWFKYIMENYSAALEQVYSAKLERNTICGAPEMFVYKINWRNVKLQ